MWPILENIVSSSNLLIRAHLHCLYSQFDPVCRIVPQNCDSNRGHFCFALIIILISIFTGTIWLQYNAVGRIVWADFPTSPHIFSHQCTPQSNWSQFDISASIALTAIVLFYLSIILLKSIDPKFVFIFKSNQQKFTVGSKELTSADSDCMIAFYNGKVKHLIGFFVALLIVFLAFYYTNVWLNNVYTFDAVSLTFWLLLFPVAMFYCIYASFVLVVFILIANRLIRIRQLNLLNELNALIDQIKMKKRTNKLLNWLRFKRINRHMLRVCGQILAYRSYCTARLSIVLPLYILTQCYQLYIVLYVPIPVKQKAFFGNLFVTTNAFLFALIRECAELEKNNRKFESGCRKFRLKMTKFGRPVAVACNLVKAESWQAYRRLRPYAFCVLGNMRITTKSYNAILSYISAFFMFVFKKQYS